MKKASKIITGFNKGEYKALIKDLYIEDARLTKQKNRYVTALKQFIELYGDEEVEIYSAPGRSEICGMHTDHQHGKMLACSVNRDIIAVVTPTDDNVVRLVSEGFPDIRPITISKAGLKLTFDEQGTTESLIKGIVSQFQKLGYKVGGFKAYITSEVPLYSGMSSSAAIEVLLATILNGLYNSGSISSLIIAQIAQYAENIYFGKPCGLMDQAACAIGGLIKIDFKDPKKPLIKKQMIKFEQFNHSLCIVDTKDVPANLTKEYRAIIEEMRSVAKYFGKEFLREVDENEFYEHIIPMRKVCSDRAILRAMHFYSEEKRVNKELKALRDGNFNEFKIQVKRSGNSSFEYLQNVYSSKDPSHQNISLAICMSEKILKDKGVVRVHGPGFEGTIQVFVENDYARKYKNEIEKYMGKHCCYVTHIRQQGAMKVI